VRYARRASLIVRAAGGNVAESAPFNQVYYTSVSPNDVLNHLSMVRAPGWYPTVGGPATIVWSHKYMTQAVLIIGVVLLITTCIGGLLLLARSDEYLTATVTADGGRTKIVMSGAADQYMAGAMFQALNQLPSA
jgi:hypothetical protein